MEQMRARVDLVHALTHEGRGRRFERGKPQILTKPSEIAYYKAQSEFSVTMLASAPAPAPVAAKPVAKPTAAKPAAAKPGKPAAKPAPVVEEAEEEAEEPEDDAEDTEEPEEGTEETTEEAAEEVEEEASPILKKADLEAMTKAALVELGKDDFALTLNAEWSKAKLVGEILKAQIARASEATE